MTQQVWKCSVEFTSTDVFVDNPSWDFIVEQTGSSTNLNQSTVVTALTNLFNSVPGGGSRAFGAYFGPSVSRATGMCVITAYDITTHLDGSPAGAPIWVSTFTLVAASTGTPQGLPEGACLLLGFHSDYGSDPEYLPSARPRQTHRGRFYFGPIDGRWGAMNATGRYVWGVGSIVTDAKAAIGSMLTYGGSADVPSLVQWSRKNARVLHITGVYVEDGPRYQRRRVDLGNKV